MVARYGVSEMQDWLANWDRASTAVRCQMLQNFLLENKGCGAPELEINLAQAGSLVLARFTAWLQLTHNSGTCLSLLLQAIEVFACSSSGHRFLSEFLEADGLRTTLELLGNSHSMDEDQRSAISLLSGVARTSRKHKEMICEAFGVRAIAECLARSSMEETQEAARLTLLCLAEGNPKFEKQLYKTFIALLACSSPIAQRMAAQSLRIVQPIVVEANPNIVQPTLRLLQTMHPEVQYQAIELIKHLVQYGVRGALLDGLVQNLVPEDQGQEKLSLPALMKQAASGKSLGILCQQSADLLKDVAALKPAGSLMIALGNVAHADSQRQAALTLKFICERDAATRDAVRRTMGDKLFTRFEENSEGLYDTLSAIDIDILLSNKLTM